MVLLNCPSAIYSPPILKNINKQKKVRAQQLLTFFMQPGCHSVNFRPMGFGTLKAQMLAAIPWH